MEINITDGSWLAQLKPSYNREDINDTLRALVLRRANDPAKQISLAEYKAQN